MITCKDQDGAIKRFRSVKSVLRYINADRSPDWTNYTRHDWREGLQEFTELTIVKES